MGVLTSAGVLIIKTNNDNDNDNSDNRKHNLRVSKAIVFLMDFR